VVLPGRELGKQGSERRRFGRLKCKRTANRGVEKKRETMNMYNLSICGGVTARIPESFLPDSQVRVVVPS
jgi:hypothetical protein